MSDKFTGSGLQPVDGPEPCPRCGALDTWAFYTPEPGVVGEPPAIKCDTCGEVTWLNISTGQWNLP